MKEFVMGCSFLYTIFRLLFVYLGDQAMLMFICTIFFWTTMLLLYFLIYSFLFSIILYDKVCSDVCQFFFIIIFKLLFLKIFVYF